MSLAISEDVKFDCNKIQLKYGTINDINEEQDEYVNRYAITRKDNGKLLGIHSDEYIVRPYYELAEKVNKVVEECVDIDKYKITTKDQVLDGGKKYRRDINFWDDSIDMSKFKSNGMHIQGADERIVPQLRIYSSLDGRWGQQIMWSSVYVVCLNGMVRPDWTFVVYNKHNKREDITFAISDFKSGVEAHQELGEDLFKMMQKQVKVSDVKHLFKKTLANRYTKLDIDDTSENIMEDLNVLWTRYVARYKCNLFAVYQTATDWASHPDTRGAIHNVSRKREKEVAKMMNSPEWLGLAA
tara:strand:- start:46 stop:939 length:894 start_codon:yes stop_codon:yes gene_type:complete